MSINTPKPWPEGTMPTPEQWANWFVMLPNGEKLEVAQAVLDLSTQVTACFTQDHEGQLSWLSKRIDRAIDQKEVLTKKFKSLYQQCKKIATETAMDDAIRSGFADVTADAYGLVIQDLEDWTL